MTGAVDPQNAKGTGTLKVSGSKPTWKCGPC